VIEPSADSVRYREATTADVPDIARARLADSAAGPADRRMAAYLDGAHHPQQALAPRVAFAAFEGATVVGYIAGHLTRRYDCDGELQYLWVREDQRRRGVASELLALLARWFAGHEASQICVGVEPDNRAARSFYSDHGATDLNEHFLEWRDVSLVLGARDARGSEALDGEGVDCGGHSDELIDLFGNIDVYVFDQILRGRITPSMTVLDAGCGGGRNARYLMRVGANVFGVDREPQRIREIRALAEAVAPDLPKDNFQVGGLVELPFEDGRFDAVLCNAVLHFAADELEFETMLREMWRVLAPGGVFFARLASDIGIEDRVTKVEGRWHRLPDGSDRFLVDEPYLLRLAEKLGATSLDPIKTTNVQNLRAMTTWVVGKPI